VSGSARATLAILNATTFDVRAGSNEPRQAGPLGVRAWADRIPWFDQPLDFQQGVLSWYPDHLSHRSIAALDLCAGGAGRHGDSRLFFFRSRSVLS
jgi:hypothetical protein